MSLIVCATSSFWRHHLRTASFPVMSTIIAPQDSNPINPPVQCTNCFRMVPFKPCQTDRNGNKGVPFAIVGTFFPCSFSPSLICIRCHSVNNEGRPCHFFRRGSRSPTTSPTLPVLPTFSGPSISTASALPVVSAANIVSSWVVVLPRHIKRLQLPSRLLHLSTYPFRCHSLSSLPPHHLLPKLHLLPFLSHRPATHSKQTMSSTHAQILDMQRIFALCSPR